MHRMLLFAAFGWLIFISITHFAIDVVSQHMRGVHPPGPERTLYYGLHSAFSLGQFAFGLMGLFVATRAVQLFAEPTLLVLALLAGLGWLAIIFLFMPYWQPRVMVGIYCLLVVAALLNRART
ncbi:MAG: hypothetical protein DI568_04805 [Sphingomonas sp.]|nr:MAG: hypothetical protein DI568_04805 [Sphingomonas sp.]